MIYPAATEDFQNHVEDFRTEHAGTVGLLAEISRLHEQLARTEERLNERVLDVEKAQNEVKRQQARVENGMRWAEERRAEFLQVCAERDSLEAQVRRLQSKSD